MHPGAVANGRPMTKDEIEVQNNHTIELIAKMCHEANRSYCAQNGDDSQKAWEESPEWAKDSARNGVKMHISNKQATPEESHESWYRQKREEGWIWGPVKDPEKKTHPCMLAYHELPYEQQLKDSIFVGIAKGMIAKAMGSGRLLVQRVPTDGEEAIDVSFNVGGNPVVAKIKQGFADLHDLCIKMADQHRVVILNRGWAERRKVARETNPDWDADQVEKAIQGFPIPAQVQKMGRLMAMALTDIENGAMHAVKAITR